MLACKSFPGRHPTIFNAPPRNPHFTGRGELLAALARRLGLPEPSSLEEQVQVLLDEPGRQERWLPVYDNITTPHSLDGLRPPAGSGQLLITSRNLAWGGIAATIGVDVPELLALGHPSDSEQTIATTWTVALHRLRDQTPGAEDLLALWAFLAADDIPSALAAEHSERLPERLAATVRDPLAYQQAIAELRRYSLLKTSQGGQALSVHRLVQAVTRQQLDLTQQQQWATAALTCSARPSLLGTPVLTPGRTVRGCSLM